MKAPYRIRLLISFVFLFLCILVAEGIFYQIKVFDLQILPLIQRVFIDFSLISLGILLCTLILTFIFGRFYCSLLCPLGILQELFSIIAKKFNKRGSSYIKNKSVKYFILAIVFATLLSGFTLCVRFFDPYTLFVSAFSLSLTGVFAIIIIFGLVFFKNRFFCTSICPVGAILGIISKFSVNKIYIDETNCVSCGMCEKICPASCINSKEKFVDNETCIKCLKCLEICNKSAIKYGKRPEQIVKFNPERRKFIVGGAVVALFAGMAKFGIELKDKTVTKFKNIIFPPGCVSQDRILNTCYNCNLCVQNCPMHIIKKADEEFSVVHIDYSNGYCKEDCNICGQICPTGAIKRLSLEEKQKIRMGIAVKKYDNCKSCRDCINECPYGAIYEKNGEIIFDGTKCVGCGKCKLVCHHSAIEIYAVREQQQI